MKIYNTLTRTKEEFVPVYEGEVRIYSCGPTVYDYFHIGNARPFIVFDTLRNYLEYKGYKVTFVQNFTDIDDKMINRANEEKITVKELADKFIKEYYKDADALNIKRATVAPRATDHIGDIIKLIQTLIQNGKAYVSDGDVYYSARTFDEYGKLSRQQIEELESGARVEVSDIKHDPLDFALWKAAKPGEPSWDSPWGKGRPGWHIECSAMSMRYLGDTFDIHCGGQDLIFPHHENEIAQSEGATGKPFARYWMHNGYININNAKMSKSLGNFFTVRQILDKYDPMAVRLLLLSAQYRNPINFSDALMEHANNALVRIRNAREYLDRLPDEGGELPDSLSGFKQSFIEAMDDDLNTADALGVVFELVRECNIIFKDTASGAKKALALLDELLGVVGIKLETQLELPQQVLTLKQQREEARKNKDWAESDRLRDEIIKLGYIVEDTKQGQVIKKA